MIGGRRRVLAMAGAVLIGGAMMAALLLSNGPKPVDVRQVQGSFGPEPVLSATYTTSVLGVGPATPPAPPPAPAETAQEQPAEPTTTAESSESTRHLSTRLEDTGGCDDDYDTDGVCVPRLFPILVDECGWLRTHGSRHIEVRGEDRHELDGNLDGIACGDGDR